MRVDVRSICFRQSDTRVDVDACCQLARSAARSALSCALDSEALITYGTYSQRVPTSFRASSPETDFPVSRYVTQYIKGEWGNV